MGFSLMLVLEGVAGIVGSGEVGMHDLYAVTSVGVHES